MRTLTLRCLHQDGESSATYPVQVSDREALLKAVEENEVLEAHRMADGKWWTVGARRERIVQEIDPMGGYQGEAIEYDLGWRAMPGSFFEQVPPEGDHLECQPLHEPGRGECPNCGYDPPPF